MSSYPTTTMLLSTNDVTHDTFRALPLARVNVNQPSRVTPPTTCRAHTAVDKTIKNDQPYGPAPPPLATVPYGPPAETAAVSPQRQKRLLTATTNEADSGGGSSDSDEEHPEGIVGDHWPHPPCDLGGEVGGGVATAPGNCSKRPQRRILW